MEVSSQDSDTNRRLDPLLKDVIYPAISELAGAEKNELTLQAIIDKLEDEIVSSQDNSQTMAEFRRVWIKRLVVAALSMHVPLSDKKASWKAIEKKLKETAQDDDNQRLDAADAIATTTATASTGPSSPTSGVSESSATSVLKRPFTDEDKAEIRKVFDNLDKSCFWYLKATKDKAAENGEEAESVEEKMMKFALQCDYLHPCHSMILDLNDQHWHDVFSNKELRELEEHGRPILRSLPKEVVEILNEVTNLKSPLEAYSYGRTLPHDPTKDSMKAWLALSLQNTSHLFLKEGPFNLVEYLETDQLYIPWGFVNTALKDSAIKAIGKEKASTANAEGNNSKRRMSAIDEIANKKMGRKTDTVYVGGGIKLGCLEIGGAADSTKEMRDSMFKMPAIMKDMLLRIVTTIPSLVHQAHILGYAISGEHITLLDMDAPKGFVTRIRRLKKLPYPTSSDEYTSRMSSLLELACVGKAIMEETLEAYRHTRIPLAPDTAIPRAPLPPCFTHTASTSTLAFKRKRSV